MKRDKSVVVFLPDWSHENPYLNCLATALEKFDFKVVLDDYAKGIFPLFSTARKYPTAGVIHLHWVSPLINRYYWSRNPIKRIPKFILYYLVLALDIWLTRRSGVRLMWTVHNLYNHEARNTSIELKIRRLLAARVDGLFFHSDEASRLVLQEYGVQPRNRIAITPHACYGAFYDVADGDAEKDGFQFEVEPGVFTYLFFGNIRRYKGLETLVRAFSQLEGEGRRLIIAGKIREEEDEIWLSEVVTKDPRIILKKGFIPDQSVAALIKLSDAVVLPFVRTLSSGSALLAITYGRPLILPEAAKVFGVPGIGGAIYFSEDYPLQQAMRDAESLDLSAYRNHNYRLADRLTWGAMAKTTGVNYTK